MALATLHVRSGVPAMAFTRITVFHVLWLAAVVGGAIGGVAVGRGLGPWGGLSGAVLGIVAGHFVGWLPAVLSTRRLFRQTAAAATEELRAIVAEPAWGFGHTLALLHLAARGEPVAGELPRIVALLESDDAEQRVFGRDALRLVFVEENRLIAEFDPYARINERRRLVGRLKAGLARRA